VALVPELLRDHRLDGLEDPLLLALQVPGLPVAPGLRVVRSVEPFGGGVLEEPDDRRVAPEGASARPVPLLVQEPGNGLEAPVLQEELVDEQADGGLLRVDLELPVLPPVAEGGGAPEGLPELRPDGDRRCDPGGDLLPLPLGEGRDHGVEEAARGGGGVDCLLEGDEVSAALLEEIRELQKLLGVTSETGEL